MLWNRIKVFEKIIINTGFVFPASVIILNLLEPFSYHGYGGKTLGHS